MKTIKILAIVFFSILIIKTEAQLKVNSNGVVEINGGAGWFTGSAPRININSNNTTLNSVNTGLSIFNTDLTNNNWVRMHLTTLSSDGIEKDFVSIGAQFRNHTINNETADFFIATRGNGTYSEKFRIKGNGSVGIGTSSPTYGKLHISGEGSNQGINLYSNSGSTFRIFRQSDIAYITRGGSTYKGLILTSNGHVGINRTPSSAYWLDVNGSIRVNYTVYNSDKRLKTNISVLNEDIYDLSSLKGVSYNLIPQVVNDEINDNDEKVVREENKPDNRIHYGFIAQDVKEVFPELVYEDDNGYLGIDYVSFIPLLVEAYKKQEQKIEELERALKDIEGVSLNIEEINNENNIVYQNFPNPFNEKTEIRFNLEKTINNARLIIYDMQGSQLQSISINQRGEGSVIIEGSSLKPGMYLYTILADSKEIGTKRMILTE